MNTQTAHNIIGILLIAIGFLTMLGTLISYSELNKNPEQQTKLVPCYDNYNNEIIGAECQEVTYEYKYSWIILVGAIVCSFIILLGAVFIDGGFNNE